MTESRERRGSAAFYWESSPRLTKRQHLTRAARALGCELKALFILAAMISGALAYVLIADQGLGLVAAGHQLRVAVAVAVASALRELPRVHGRLKDRQEPLTVYFSRAFGAGLRAPLSLLPNLSKWTTKAQTFWRGLRRGPGG